MDKRSIEQMLDTYGQALADSGKQLASLSGLPEEARADLESLVRLSYAIKDTLTPVYPRSAFRDDLYYGLLAAAAERRELGAGPVGQIRRHWKITAAATASGVSAVAVGAITVVAWYRMRSNA